MKKAFSLIAVLILMNSTNFAQDIEYFDRYFTDQTMRIDYYHIGDANEEYITLDQIYQYGIWAGSRVRLIDEMDLGRYAVKIYDGESNLLIYSKGFDSYFGEYKTSDRGLDGIQKTYHETVLIPFPKGKIIFSFASSLPGWSFQDVTDGAPLAMLFWRRGTGAVGIPYP